MGFGQTGITMKNQTDVNFDKRKTVKTLALTALASVSVSMPFLSTAKTVSVQNSALNVLPQIRVSLTTSKDASASTQYGQVTITNSGTRPVTLNALPNPYVSVDGQTFDIGQHLLSSSPTVQAGEDYHYWVRPTNPGKAFGKNPGYLETGENDGLVSLELRNFKRFSSELSEYRQLSVSLA